MSKNDKDPIYLPDHIDTTPIPRSKSGGPAKTEQRRRFRERFIPLVGGVAALGIAIGGTAMLNHDDERRREGYFDKPTVCAGVFVINEGANIRKDPHVAENGSNLHHSSPTPKNKRFNTITLRVSEEPNNGKWYGMEDDGKILWVAGVNTELENVKPGDCNEQ